MINAEVNIGGKKVGDNHPCFIVAEAGVSHFGSVTKALELVDAAVAAKADAIKFQIFQTDELISRVARDWIERMRPKELSLEAFRSIQAYCAQKDIIFFATAHDVPSLTKLSQLDPPAYKIGSGELQNYTFFQKVAAFRKPIIFSTGMYAEKDIVNTIDTLERAGCSEAVALHCVTGYPVPPEMVNLSAINSLKKLFPGPVGYSDHSEDWHIPAASVLLGADLIERHITIEKNIPNAQDWKVACDPDELRDFVALIRRFEAVIGDGALTPTELEKENLKWARKSIVAAVDIDAGEIISADRLQIKRPGDGISPAEINKVVGRQARVKIHADSLINWDQLK